MQLTERRQGNKAYRARDYKKALHHYERAQAVVEFVQVGGAVTSVPHLLHVRSPGVGVGMVPSAGMLCAPSMH